MKRREFRKKLTGLLRHPALYPASRLLSWAYQGRCTCLMYHRIVPATQAEELPRGRDFAPNRILDVRLDRFEDQIRWIAENTRCLGLTEASELLVKGGLPRNSTIVTFDDGFRDNLTLALPILEKYQVPATIYVATGLIDRTTDLWWQEVAFILGRLEAIAFTWEDREFAFPLSTVAEKDAAFSQISALFKRLNRERLGTLLGAMRAECDARYSYDAEVLSWDEVRKLDRHPLITIAAHTVNHLPLKHLTVSEVEWEVLESGRRLEQELGRKIEHFSYPYGDIDQVGGREFDVARKLGFRSSVTTRPGHLHRAHKAFMHSLPRVIVDYWDDIESFRFKLSGLDSMIQQRGRRLVTN